MERVTIAKTYKLFINGAFPRSESERSLRVVGPGGGAVHVPRGSRKDLRNAVVAARGAASGWRARDAFNRGQILYRLAEQLEARRDEFASALAPMAADTRTINLELDATIDRLVCWAGWTDKFQGVVGGTNAVAGPYHNFTAPDSVGVVGVVCPDVPALLGLWSLVAPALCGGNTVVALVSERCGAMAEMAGELCATADVPAGAVNLLSGYRRELVPHFAGHRDIDALVAADVSDESTRVLRGGAAENLKRVSVLEVDTDGWLDGERCEGAEWIMPFVELKTVWHPAGV